MFIPNFLVKINFIIYDINNIKKIKTTVYPVKLTKLLFGYIIET